MSLSSFNIGDGTQGTVLLHGFMGSGKNLRTLAQRWSERDPSRIFYLPDLPGHGTSPKVSDTTDLREMGEAVLAGARAAGLKGPLDLVGHSLGGRVSLAAALAKPEDVRNVVLLDITPSPIQSDVSESGAVISVLAAAPEEAKDRRELRDWLTNRGLSAPIADWLMMNVEQKGETYRWRFDRHALQRLHARVNREDLWSAIDQLGGTRVRVIRGARSRYVPPEDAARFEKAGVRVDVVPSGHFVHVEALVQLLDLLTRG